VKLNKDYISGKTFLKIFKEKLTYKRSSRNDEIKSRQI